MEVAKQDLIVMLQENVIPPVAHPFQILAEQEYAERQQTEHVDKQIVERVKQVSHVIMQQGSVFLYAEMV